MSKRKLEVSVKGRVEPMESVLEVPAVTSKKESRKECPLLLLRQLRPLTCTLRILGAFPFVTSQQVSLSSKLTALLPTSLVLTSCIINLVGQCILASRDTFTNLSIAYQSFEIIFWLHGTLVTVRMMSLHSRLPALLRQLGTLMEDDIASEDRPAIRMRLRKQVFGCLLFVGVIVVSSLYTITGWSFDGFHQGEVPLETLGIVYHEWPSPWRQIGAVCFYVMTLLTDVMISSPVTLMLLLALVTCSELSKVNSGLATAALLADQSDVAQKLSKLRSHHFRILEIIQETDRMFSALIMLEYVTDCVYILTSVYLAIYYTVGTLDEYLIDLGLTCLGCLVLSFSAADINTQVNTCCHFFISSGLCVIPLHPAVLIYYTFVNIWDCLYIPQMYIYGSSCMS